MNRITSAKEKEKAVLVCLASPTESSSQVESKIKELELLSETAGVTVYTTFQQKRDKPDSSYYIGRGKLQEIKETVYGEEIEVVIFNEELSPVQARNLENYLEIKVLDRTALILDIFAGRARTKEGKLQVEMAQLQYLLTRLIGYGSSLSRLGGGIGTRGPGETKLEIDRRRIRKRIRDLNRSLEEVKKHRHLHRKQRKKDGYFTVSLVGYTNAGKSTLLNSLSGEQLFTENKLFATLDPTVRKVELENGKEALLSDTVGFIQDMPSQLMRAFKATLEEINEAGLILHVVDISHPEHPEQIEAVEQVLQEISEEDQNVLMVFNKMDNAPPLENTMEKLTREYPNSVFISAREGTGLDRLKHQISRFINEDKRRVVFQIPYEEMGFLDQLFQNARVINQNYREEYLQVEAETTAGFVEQNRRYLEKGVSSIIGEE